MWKRNRRLAYCLNTLILIVLIQPPASHGIVSILTGIYICCGGGGGKTLQDKS
jgi:hypothetical protein